LYIYSELTNSPKPQSPSTDARNDAGKKKSKTKLRKVDYDYLEKALIERHLYEMFCLLSND